MLKKNYKIPLDLGRILSNGKCRTLRITTFLPARGRVGSGNSSMKKLRNLDTHNVKYS
jgi:hypothetical protein